MSQSDVTPTYCLNAMYFFSIFLAQLNRHNYYSFANCTADRPFFPFHRNNTKCRLHHRQKAPICQTLLPHVSFNPPFPTLDFFLPSVEVLKAWNAVSTYPPDFHLVSHCLWTCNPFRYFLRPVPQTSANFQTPPLRIFLLNVSITVFLSLLLLWPPLIDFLNGSSKLISSEYAASTHSCSPSHCVQIVFTDKSVLENPPISPNYSPSESPARRYTLLEIYWLFSWFFSGALF